jgi:hypothetical protein
VGGRTGHPGRRAAESGGGRRAPAQVFPGRAGWRRGAGPRRHQLVALLARGPSRQSVLAGRHGGRRGAHERMPGPVPGLGREPPARGRGTARSRRIRGARAMAAHPRPVPAGRVRPHRSHRDRLPGPGRGPAGPGQSPAGGALGAPFGRDQRLPAVRGARSGRDRLHRGRDVR